MTTTFPSTHVTTTTTTSSTTTDEKKLYMNKGFVRTEHGYMKILQIVTCLLGFICIMSPGFPYNITHDAKFVSFVTVTGILVSSILLFLYFINAVVFVVIIPWLLMELVYCGLWCFFCFVGGIVAATASNKYAVGNVAFAASAFFLFLGMCFYGYYAFKLFLLHRQGVRLVVVTTEITTTVTRT